MKKFINCLGLFLLVGCGVKRVGSGGSGSHNEKYISSYYKGEEKMLYFVKPVLYEHDLYNLLVDYTFQMKDTVLLDSVLMNYSLIHSDKLPQQNIDKLIVSEVEFEPGSPIFNEKLNKEIKIRKSLKLSGTLFKKLIEQNKLDLVYNGKKLEFQLKDNSFQKELKKIISL